MSSLEIFALIFALLGLIKIIVIAIKPKALLKVGKVIFRNPNKTIPISFILAGVSLFFLLKEISIVTLFAAFFFLSMIMIMSASSYSKDILELTEKLYKQKNILKKSWFPILIWLCLVFWLFFELFLR